MGRGGPKRAAAAKRARKPAPKRRRVPPSQRRAVEAALAALAHDIRTPLTGILALAELLAASDLPERERGWARAIGSAADHLAQQTSIVLDAVKADTAGLVLRREPFSPRRLAEAIAVGTRYAATVRIQHQGEEHVLVERGEPNSDLVDLIESDLDLVRGGREGDGESEMVTVE